MQAAASCTAWGAAWEGENPAHKGTRAGHAHSGPRPSPARNASSLTPCAPSVSLGASLAPRAAVNSGSSTNSGGVLGGRRDAVPARVPLAPAGREAKGDSGAVPGFGGEGEEEGVPGELAALTQLVSELAQRSGGSGDEEVGQLKEAFGELAEDLKRQLSAVRAVSPAPTSHVLRPGLTGVPGATWGGAQGPSPLSRSSSSSGGARAGLIDLEGLIPLPQALTLTPSPSPLDPDDPTSAPEPSVRRSEVIAMRSRLNKRLSESNTYNRFLLREIQYREEALRDNKAVLLALLAQLKDLSVGLTELSAVESSLPSLVRSSCLPSQLQRQLEDPVGLLEKQLAGIESMILREVPLTWFGMAEDVKVMGSFDGWTYGQQMSPEATGTMTRFHTVLKLRPGRYEIKFVVDGEWRVAPEWPTVGHGMTENNIIVVD